MDAQLCDDKQSHEETAGEKPSKTVLISYLGVPYKPNSDLARET